MGILDKSLEIAKSSGRKAATAISNNISDSFFSGQYVRHARSVGITDPYKLAKVNGTKEGKNIILNHLRQKHGPYTNTWDREFKAHVGNKGNPGIFRDLHNKTRRARMITATGVAGTIYAKNKISDKIDQMKDNSQYQYAYSY